MTDQLTEALATIVREIVEATAEQITAARPPAREVYRPDEVAAILDIPVGRVRTLCAAGDIPTLPRTVSGVHHLIPAVWVHALTGAAASTASGAPASPGAVNGAARAISPLAAVPD